MPLQPQGEVVKPFKDLGLDVDYDSISDWSKLYKERIELQVSKAYKNLAQIAVLIQNNF